MRKLRYLMLLFSPLIFSQVLISIDSFKTEPHEDAILDLQSKKGVLIIPSNSAESVNKIKNNKPVAGMIIFDNKLKQFSGYNGEEWVVFHSSIPSTIKPIEGEVIFTEFMIDPLGEERYEEWFEVYNTTAKNLNLETCIFKNNAYSFEVNGDLTIPAQGFLVLGPVKDKSLNNGVEIDYAYGFSSTYSNFNFSNGNTSNANNITLECGGLSIDKVLNLSNNSFPIAEGSSTTLKPNSFNSNDNDLPNNYYASGTITPGTMNQSAPTIIAGDVRINEFHYKNSGSAVNEFVEIRVKKGLDISAITVYLYNGKNGKISHKKSLSTLAKTNDVNFDYYVWERSLQDGPDGIALANTSELIEFFSYGGTFSGTEGPTNGKASNLIPYTETASTLGTSSIARSENSDWFISEPNSKGSANQ